METLLEILCRSSECFVMHVFKSLHKMNKHNQTFQKTASMLHINKTESPNVCLCMRPGEHTGLNSEKRVEETNERSCFVFAWFP